MNQSSRSRTDALALAGFCAFLFFFGLNSFGLLGADEPRYAQVAREMLQRQDWITPTLGGKPWLEKPVLYYWEAMLAYRLFGVSDWAARLPSAMSATWMVLAIYWFLRRFRPGSELDGALLTASSAAVVGFSRAAAPDMLLAANFTMALLAWYAWHESGERRYLAFSYFFLGLAVLAKGPVAVGLATLILLVFSVAQRSFRPIVETLWFPGITLFSLVALPWYFAVQYRNPEFFRVFILEHNLVRFGTNLYHHQQPFWYYLPVTLLALVPYTVFALAALRNTIRRWWGEGRAVLQSQDALDVFLSLWLCVPVLFFSLSQSKLPGYILPAVPAATVLVAIYVQRHLVSGERPPVLLLGVHSLLAALPVVPALMIQYLLTQHHLPWGRATLVSFLVAALLAVSMLVTLLSRLGLRMLRFVTLVPVLLATAFLLRVGGPMLDSILSTRPLAIELARLESKPLPVAVFRVSRQTEFGLAFYRNQTIDRYDRGEIPAGEHLLVSPERMLTAIAELVGSRRVSYLGSLPDQQLNYYWVSAPGMAHQH
jgi:4-amino-4-deoxy-L-arabinose transferase-like glycosyltransferase